MFAITGVTGQVGGAAARALLDAGHAVRAVLRDASKAAQWTERGADVAIASFDDADALAAAFSGTAGVFVMVAPNFAPQPGYPNAHAAGRVLKEALTKARPARVAALSSIGGQRESGLGLITQVHILEQALADLPIPTAFLRPAWSGARGRRRKRGGLGNPVTPILPAIKKNRPPRIGRQPFERQRASARSK